MAFFTPAICATDVALPACKSQSGDALAMTFPRRDSSDLALARSMLPAVALGLSYKPAPPTCSRGAVKTAIGELRLAGEDGNLFPRTATRLDGKAGGYAFVARQVGLSANPTYALVIVRKDGSVAAHRFYAGMPSDAALLADLVKAASESEFILAERQMPGGTADAPAIQVVYGFEPPAEGPPPARSGDGGDGMPAGAGPQFMVSDGSMPYLDLTHNGLLIHRPSGSACPQSLADGTILLEQVDARAGSLVCSYRQGPSLALDPKARVKYRLLVVRDRGSVAAAMKDITASARKALAIAADKAPPLEPGAATQPQAAQFWVLKDGSVEGLWLSKVGDWMTRLQVDYADSPANDAEARLVAQTFFSIPARQPGR